MAFRQAQHDAFEAMINVSKRRYVLIPDWTPLRFELLRKVSGSHQEKE